MPQEHLYMKHVYVYEACISCHNTALFSKSLLSKLVPVDILGGGGEISFLCLSSAGALFSLKKQNFSLS